MLLDLSERGRGARASTRSGSATACSRSRARSRSRCSRRSRSARPASGSAPPAWSRRRATRSTSRSSGRRSTRSRAAARSSARGWATRRRACGASSRRSGSTTRSAARSSRRASPSCARSGRRGRSRFHGEHFDYDDVAFFSGTEMGPLMPVQKPPPIWVVSNPRLKGDAPPEVMRAPHWSAACRRIVQYGDGWMTCCRAQHPEELVEQLELIRDAAERHGADYERLVDLLPGDDEHRRLGGRGATRRSTTTSRSTTRSSRRRWTSRTGGRSARPEQIAGLAPHLRRGRRRPLHLPLRRDRPVRPGGAVREGRAARCSAPSE